MLAKRHLFIAAAVTMAFGFAATAADAAGLFTLQSKTFQDGKIMPKKMANANPSGKAPNCVGENVSPELSWSNVPDGTKSLVLLMFDPEGRAPFGVSHWVAYGIDPSKVTGFAEGAASKDSSEYVGGKSLMGVGHYSGPCTPPGQTAHHYTFTLIATDFAPDELPAGLTREDLTAKFGAPPSPHVKGVSGLIGLFVNPWHD
ncbi:MAG TPA: YbhB/YbcL family Raf kinase inhibitor-like protein [Xanthobacteraceae bacterium]|nr:YbhB/YbcL family Raf kinase inhibitor-like protein [Xanthobacteraceae bacterium]